MRKFTYADVNKAMKNVLCYMYHIENVWNEGRNLKLYEASFKSDELLDKYPLLKAETNAYDAFNDFCDITYHYTFQEEINTGYLKDLRVYVGRTSTFYITNLYECRDDRGALLQELFENIGISTSLDFNSNGEVSPFTWSDYYTEEELIDEYQDDMEYIVTKFIYDVKEYMKDAVKLAKYIDDFKKRQVEAFDEYLYCENENIIERLEQEAEQELEYKIQLGCEVITYAM